MKGDLQATRHWCNHRIADEYELHMSSNRAIDSLLYLHPSIFCSAYAKLNLPTKAMKDISDERLAWCTYPTATWGLEHIHVSSTSRVRVRHGGHQDKNVVGKLSLRHCLADLERRGPKGRVTCEEEGCRWCCFKRCAAVDEQRCNTEIRHVGASRGSDATGSARWKPKSRRRLRRPRRASAWL